MSHILCLIQARPQGAVANALSLERIAALESLTGSHPRWLSPGEAVEFATTRAPQHVLAGARELFTGAPVDIAIVPAAERRKRLFLSDMDSTMITVECIDELADRLKIKGEVAAITRRAMNGEIEFRRALEERVALLSGLAEAVIDEVCLNRVRPMAGAADLLATLRRDGVRTVLVSGGFKPFTRYVAELLGFDDDDANELEIVDGRLTGRLVPPIRDAASKLARLKAESKAAGLQPLQTMAVGDGANDLPMVEAAGLGVIFMGHSRVREAALAAGRVVIDHGDLTALLFLQGYCREAFASPA
ncbi:phosphoserine phosphatase [Arboricoccus pini]|uniref:Phosphoserine phosphatase n=1 Tax=Arboricoccus pini TaxID=1963835 RepID=A0A212QYS0_9PROT|nr:phosphoserine phosphatase SerB [Arboricoccus pini]SNB64865.1 phosphoserine phosphatase [Arboricoccus pini]